MSPRWLNSLVRARQLQEDAARQHLASSERLALRAHARERLDAGRLDDLIAGGSEHTVAGFVAAAAAMQACAAAHAAAQHATVQAESCVAVNRDRLGEHATRRKGAEELQERYVSLESAKAATLRQREMDEIAARVHRDRHASAPGGAGTGVGGPHATGPGSTGRGGGDPA